MPRDERLIQICAKSAAGPRVGERLVGKDHHECGYQRAGGRYKSDAREERRVGLEAMYRGDGDEEEKSLEL